MPCTPRAPQPRTCSVKGGQEAVNGGTAIWHLDRNQAARPPEDLDNESSRRQEQTADCIRRCDGSLRNRWLEAENNGIRQRWSWGASASPRGGRWQPWLWVLREPGAAFPSAAVRELHRAHPHPDRQLTCRNEVTFLRVSNRSGRVEALLRRLPVS